MPQFQLITRSIFSATDTHRTAFMGCSIYTSPSMWLYVLKHWLAIVTHHRTSSPLVLATKSKMQSQKLTEYGLLKLGYGNSSLSFIYPRPTFKATVISLPQALKLIFESMLKSPFHLANFSLVLGSEAEGCAAFQRPALSAHVTCSPPFLAAARSNTMQELLSPHRDYVGNTWNHPGTVPKHWLIAF